jgi:cytochrome P450
MSLSLLFLLSLLNYFHNHCQSALLFFLFLPVGSTHIVHNDIMFFTIILGLLVVCLTVIYRYLNHKYFGRIHKLSGLTPQWFYGNMKNSGMMSEEKVTWEVLYELKQKYGDAYSFWMGHSYCVVLSRPEYAVHVTADRNTYDHSDRTIETSKAFFPHAMECMRGNDYKRHARVLLPMFRQAKITNYFDTILTCVDRFITENFASNNNKIYRNIDKQCQNLFFSITSRIGFDCDLDESSPATVEIQEAFNHLMEYSTGEGPSVLFPNWLVEFLVKMDGKFQRSKSIIDKHVTKVVKEEQKRQEDDPARSKKPKNVIASLVAALREESSSSTETLLTLDEIVDEVITSSIVGFEPVTAALCWFIFHMSKHPDVQQKLKDELKEHELTADIPLDQEALVSLVYLDCVIKELLRFSPIDPYFVRQVMRDDKIGDIEVKKGDTILIALVNMHLDPRYWNIDPSKFIPERWLDEDKSPPNGAYLPFGGGHRSCIGEDLAWIEMRICIVRLMQRLTFKDPGTKANNSGGYIETLNCFPKHLAVYVCVDSN